MYKTQRRFDRTKTEIVADTKLMTCKSTDSVVIRMYVVI